MSAPINIAGQFGFTNTPITAAQNATFETNYHILSQIGRRQRLAIMVNALVTRNWAQSFFDYRSKHAQLFTDSRLFTRGISNMNEIAAQAAVYGAIGVVSGTVSADLQSQMITVSDLENLSEDELWRMIVMLYAAWGN
jgi:hypothetical protein